jgi:hypothetical protein
MSAAQDSPKAMSTGSKGPRRLAVARHAQGVDALGWVLLGFVLGAGAAIAVLMNASFVHRGPAPVLTASQGPSVHVQAEPALQPAVIPASVAPPRLVLPPAALIPAPAAKPATPAPGAAPASRKARPAVSEAVADDAAAAGMTSRSEGGDSGLY